MKSALWMMAAMMTLMTVLFPALAEDKPKTKGIDKPFAITAPFSKISTSGSFEVEIINSPITSVIARGDMPGLDLINAVVVGDTLQISESAAPVGVKIKDIKAKMMIQLASFNGLESTGTGKVTVKNVRTGDFTLAQRSRNELKFDNAKFSKLDVSVIDGSRVELSGNCDVINADATNGGDINAGDLRCAEANVKLGAKGNANVRAKNKVVAQLDGTGSLKVKDKPSDITVTVRNRSDVDFEN
jgi:Putative auto-transporter adhesin, head GIN domain